MNPAKYKLDLVTVQEVRRDEDGSQAPDVPSVFCGNWNANHHVGTSGNQIRS
jgi:hypothetical protein